MKKIGYSLISNIISAIVSAMIAFVAPLLLTTIDYGYSQLYLFYVSYIALLSFGWGEGLYLKFGGYKIDELPKGKIKYNFKKYLSLEIISVVVLLVVVLLFVLDKEKIIMICCLIATILYCPVLFYGNLLAGINEIERNSILHLIEKIVFCILSIILLLITKNYFSIVIADLIGKASADIYLVLYCKDIVGKDEEIQYDETMKETVFSGFKLLMSNLVGMFIIGVAKYVVKSYWDIETFGKATLAISMSNIIMIFIRSISVIIFPSIKRMKKEKMFDFYCSLNTICSFLCYFILLFSYPIKIIIFNILPNYKESIEMFLVMFPICIFECKIGLIFEPFMKANRREKDMLIINILSVLISGAASLFLAKSEKSITSILLAIVFVQLIRKTLFAFVVNRTMKINMFLDLMIDLTFVTLYLINNIILKNVYGTLLYILLLFAYLLLNRKNIKYKDYKYEE